MRVDMCIDMRTNMCINMHIDMCIDMCIDMRIDMCTDMRRDKEPAVASIHKLMPYLQALYVRVNDRKADPQADPADDGVRLGHWLHRHHPLHSLQPQDRHPR